MQHIIGFIIFFLFKKLKKIHQFHIKNDIISFNI